MSVAGGAVRPEIWMMDPGATAPGSIWVGWIKKNQLREEPELGLQRGEQWPFCFAVTG